MANGGRIFGVLVVWLALAATPALAQRVQFPSPVQPQPTAPNGGYWPTTPPSYGAPGAPPTLPATPPPPTAPSAPFAPPAFDAYATPALPTAQPYSPYATSPYAPPPNTLPPFGSQPYTPPGYAAPYGAPPPGAAYPESYGSNNSFYDTVNQATRFFQEARIRYAWLPGNGSESLDVQDIETSATFAVPIIYDQAPLLITPGFGLHLFDGPVNQAPDFADLPGQTYEGYLDFSWKPQLAPWFGGILGVRTGVYTDFQTFNSHSFRILARGMGVITMSPNLQVLIGVVYLDRVRIKLFPAGGLIWTPNQDTRWEILFPNPKLAWRLTTLPSTDLWWYIAGEYGGGSWTIQREAGYSDQFDYNDIRVMLGIETVGDTRLRTFVELGYVFNRELVYRSGMPSQFDVTDTLMLRLGAAF